ncbi:hypothetical protein KJ975_00130 [Myxococcota bacterium]|nr:hypothetical protein [Myxococcota bacterium]
MTFPEPFLQIAWIEVTDPEKERIGWGRDFDEACAGGDLDPDTDEIESREIMISDAPTPGTEDAALSEAAAVGLTEFWLSPEMPIVIAGQIPTPSQAVLHRLRGLLAAHLFARAMQYTGSAIFDADDEDVGDTVCPGCGDNSVDASIDALCATCGWTNEKLSALAEEK